MWLACVGMGLNDLDDSQQGISCFLARNSQTCFVAKKSGKIVRVIIVGSDVSRGYIYHTAVHPDHRRQGIARKLVEKSVTALEEIGIRKVALVVFEKTKKEMTSGKS